MRGYVLMSSIITQQSKNGNINLYSHLTHFRLLSKALFSLLLRSYLFNIL